MSDYLPVLVGFFVEQGDVEISHATVEHDAEGYAKDQAITLTQEEEEGCQGELYQHADMEVRGW